MPSHTPILDPRQLYEDLFPPVDELSGSNSSATVPLSVVTNADKDILPPEMAPAEPSSDTVDKELIDQIWGTAPRPEVSLDPVPPTALPASPIRNRGRNYDPIGETPIILDRRDPTHSSIPKNKPAGEKEFYDLFKFMDLNERRTPQELVDNGYHLGVIPWGDPSKFGWNPFFTDFDNGTTGKTFQSRIRGKGSAITKTMAEAWQQNQKLRAHENYREAQDKYYTKVGKEYGSKIAPQEFKIKTESGFYDENKKEYGMLYHEIPATHVVATAKRILNQLRPDLEIHKNPTLCYYLDGPPGGGKTVFAQQLVAHLGAPLVMLKLDTDQRLSERIFYTEGLEEGGTVADLSDVAYVYTTGGFLQIDDAHSQEDLAYLSLLMDPKVTEITLTGSGFPPDQRTLVRHPSFRILLTLNGEHHMDRHGRRAEMPSNLYSRMEPISDNWDSYKILKTTKDQKHWIYGHKDPKVRIFALLAIQLLDNARNHAPDITNTGSGGSVTYLQTMPSIRDLNKIMDAETLSKSIQGFPLSDPRNRAEWTSVMEGYLAGLTIGGPESKLMKKAMEAAGYNPANYTTAADIDALYISLRRYIEDTYHARPSMGGDVLTTLEKA